MRAPPLVASQIGVLCEALERIAGDTVDPRRGVEFIELSVAELSWVISALVPMLDGQDRLDDLRSLSTLETWLSLLVAHLHEALERATSSPATGETLTASPGHGRPAREIMNRLVHAST